MSLAAKEKQAQRNVSLDLLRILSMFMIVLLHTMGDSGVLDKAPGEGVLTIFSVRYVLMLSEICVNSFILLSGYFLVSSKFRVKKLLELWLEVFFYSLGIRIIFMAAGIKPFSIVSLASCFFPFMTGRYWFITIYVGLYLLFPFLNIAIHAMNKRQHTVLNFLLFVLFSAWSSIHPRIAGMNSGGPWGLAWFVVLYFTAAWFRLYYVPERKAGRKIVSWIVLSGVIALCYTGIHSSASLISEVVSNWYRYDSVPVFLSSLLVFSAFLDMKGPKAGFSKWANRVAGSTLGVYLIHKHADVVPFLWGSVNLSQHLGKWYFLVVLMAVNTAIFAGCIFIDWARLKTVGRLENGKLVRRVSEILEKKAEELFHKWRLL